MPDGLARIAAAIRARPAARIAFGLLLLLYTAAIFAPLFASDRPWYARVGATSRWPVFESLSPLEIGAMAAWIVGLLASLRTRKPAATLSAAALLSGVLFGVLSPAARGLETSDWKERIDAGAVSSAVFPPIRMGFAETRLAESFRPPTWLASSEMSETGGYVQGALEPSPDPVTGFVPSRSPVEVRAGEPGRNSPWRHPLGCDGLGRDLLVRLLYGARVSLSVGLLSAAALFVIGAAVGVLAGYFGGWVDLLLSRGIEVVLCFPAFFLVLLVLASTDPDALPPVLAISLVIAVVGWPSVARLVRAEVLALREAEFVVAARALGVPPARVLLVHVLPNAVGPAIVAASFAIGSGALVEAALSYLGFGVRVPVPSWGSLVNESRSAEHWWLQLFPGLAILASVACYNLVGDAVREALDPRTPRSPRTSPGAIRRAEEERAG
jgi:peptide/nickel transport system permease protein